MSIGSPNRTVVKSLIETIQRAVDPAKLYDLLKKMFTDLDKVYSTLFEGPLPPVSGENLTNISREGMPDGVAYEDEENIFTEDQFIRKLRAALELQNEATLGVFSTVIGRFKQIDDNKTLVSSGVDSDGSTYSDDAGTGIAIEMDGNTGEFSVFQVIGGVRTNLFKINTTGIFSLGDIASYVGASPGDFLFNNAKRIRGMNAAGTALLSMMVVTPDNLVELGADAAVSGDGHVAIPRKTTVNLPAGGATRNGIIAIDATTNCLVYYSNNVRYFIPIGTIF